MKYHDFLTTLKEELKSRFSQEVTVELQTVPKNNGLFKDAFVVHMPGINIGPVIYVDGLYDDYMDGVGIREMAGRIYKEAMEHLPQNSMKLEFLYDYEQIKTKLAFGLINAKTNERRLMDLPHIDFLDLAMVFFCMIELEDGATGNMMVNNEILSQWGCSLEKIKEDALENAPRILPASIIPMIDLLRKLADRNSDLYANLDSFENCPLYVLTNDLGSNGAACMLYPDVLRKFSSQNEDRDFYILPSSIHEVILVPAGAVADTSWLGEMVQTINSEKVPTVDILSNNVYFYSGETREIAIA